jgi:hypothetical protein
MFLSYWIPVNGRNKLPLAALLLFIASCCRKLKLDKGPESYIYINTIQNKGWKINPLITITARARGAIHEHSMDQITKPKTPKNNIKTLMKNIHQNAIKYLTYLVLDKRKLDNKQSHVPPP